MPFSPKAWKDAPDTTTPLSAAALVDLETRLSDYTDRHVSSGAVLPPPLGDGHQYDLVTGGISRRCTWRAAANGGAGAWTVTGAAPFSSHVVGPVVYNRNTAANTWQAITGAPTIEVPITGLYRLEWSLTAQITGTGARPDERWAPALNGSPMFPVGAAGNVQNQWSMVQVSGARPSIALTQGDELALRHFSTTAAGVGWSFFEMRLEITPLELRP